MELSPYFCICFCVAACNSLVERNTAVTTFPLLLATSSACYRCKVYHAFAAKYFTAACFRCKVLHSLQSIARPQPSPTMRQAFTAGSTRPTMTFCLLAEFCYLLIISYRLINILIIFDLTYKKNSFCCCKAALGSLDSNLIKRIEESLIYIPFKTEQEEIAMRGAKFRKCAKQTKTNSGLHQVLFELGLQTAS